MWVKVHLSILEVLGFAWCTTMPKRKEKGTFFSKDRTYHKVVIDIRDCCFELLKKTFDSNGLNYKLKQIWATTWQNQQNQCAPSEDSDQHGRPGWSESSLSAWRKLGSLATHLAHSEDSDQTGRMPRLIWVFTGRTLTLLVLSCRGSFIASPSTLGHFIIVTKTPYFWIALFLNKSVGQKNK